MNWQLGNGEIILHGIQFILGNDMAGSRVRVLPTMVDKPEEIK